MLHLLKRFSLSFGLGVLTLGAFSQIEASSHQVKFGLYQLEGRWGDGIGSETGEFFQFQDKELSTLLQAPPQTLSIWFLQYEFQATDKLGVIFKGGYHFNELHPYGLQSGNSVIPVPHGTLKSIKLDQHNGLEDFELTGTYQIGQYKLGLGAGMPLFQADPNSTAQEIAIAWDGFRSYRLLSFVETFQYGQWLQLKADILVHPLSQSRNNAGDGNIQLLDYYGYDIWGPVGGFVGQTLSYNWYHWDNRGYTSQGKMFRKEWMWDWTLGFSYQYQQYGVKAFGGFTPVAYAEVRKDDAAELGQRTGFQASESSRNVVIGFDISTKW